MTEPDGTYGLTADEHAAVAKLADAWASICKVVGDGPTRDADLGEAVAHLHALQHAVMSNAAARAHPGAYRLLGHTRGEDQ